MRETRADSLYEQEALGCLYGGYIGDAQRPLGEEFCESQG